MGFDSQSEVPYYRSCWRLQLSARKKNPMSLVKVKPKYHVLIPPTVREKARLRVGDLLEASVERGKITFTPKSVVDRDIEISLQERRQGKVSPAYSSAEEFIRDLHRDLKRLRSKKKS
jgi:bifunctional DNA-binding transcriptional regulator/antitoxin component of YhaV-PrlF toxin-antitoxin module